jgi:hypothetical protein
MITFTFTRRKLAVSRLEDGWGKRCELLSSCECVDNNNILYFVYEES